MTDMLHEDTDGKFSLLEIEKTVIATIEKMPDDTYGWWNDFKNNLNIELENTGRERNAVHNRSKNDFQYDRSR